ncbi:unnamed protein product [Mucor hiemalis]
MNGTSVMILTLTASNVTVYTKKIFYNAMNMIFYTLGNFAGPLLMFDREKPTYKTGMVIYCIGNAVILVLLFINRQIHVRANKQRKANPPAVDFQVLEDMTDRENVGFIYKI